MVIGISLAFSEIDRFSLFLWVFIKLIDSIDIPCNRDARHFDQFPQDSIRQMDIFGVHDIHKINYFIDIPCDRDACNFDRFRQDSIYT